MAAAASTSIGVRGDWYSLDTADVARELAVDPERGLSADEARSRLETTGPNRLAGAKKESGFRAFVRQYQDFMQIILLAAAVINALVTDDIGTTVLLAGLTVFNAVIGLRQESKAEASVEALSKMMKTIARVRRGGQAIEIDAEELVPGDVVLVEAGNRIPADGRVCVAATLEIEEAALTGESLPVGKEVAPVTGENVPLGDRICMAFMNTSVTRGRGEFVVTETGMGTEIGHIADMLANTESEKTPLQKQLDSLSKIIAIIAGIALALVIGLGLLRDESFDTLFVTGVTLAVAAIPTGLPAVVTALLSLGTQEIARTERDREAASGRRNPRVDVRDLFGQDRDPHAQQDDRPRDGDPGAEPVHGHRGGLFHAGRDQARRGITDRPRPLPAPDDPVRRRRPRGRRADRRPHRRRPDRARRQGRAGRGRDPRHVPADRGGPVRLRVQVHGDVPRDDGTGPAGTSSAAT